MFNKAESDQKGNPKREKSSKKVLAGKSPVFLRNGQNHSDNTGFLEDMYRRYWYEICHYLRAKYGDGPPDPEDIAQVTFTKFATYQTPEHIRNPRACTDSRTWLRMGFPVPGFLHCHGCHSCNGWRG